MPTIEWNAVFEQRDLTDITKAVVFGQRHAGITTEVVFDSRKRLATLGCGRLSTIIISRRSFRVNPFSCRSRCYMKLRRRRSRDGARIMNPAQDLIVIYAS